MKLYFTVKPINGEKYGKILQNGQMRFCMASALKMAKFFEIGHSWPI